MLVSDHDQLTLRAIVPGDSAHAVGIEDVLFESVLGPGLVCQCPKLRRWDCLSRHLLFLGWSDCLTL